MSWYELYGSIFDFISIKIVERLLSIFSFTSNPVSLHTGVCRCCSCQSHHSQLHLLFQEAVGHRLWWWIGSIADRNPPHGTVNSYSASQMLCADVTSLSYLDCELVSGHCHWCARLNPYSLQYARYSPRSSHHCKKSCFCWCLEPVQSWGRNMLILGTNKSCTLQGKTKPRPDLLSATTKELRTPHLHRLAWIWLFSPSHIWDVLLLIWFEIR